MQYVCIRHTVRKNEINSPAKVATAGHCQHSYMDTRQGLYLSLYIYATLFKTVREKTTVLFLYFFYQMQQFYRSDPLFLFAALCFNEICHFFKTDFRPPDATVPSLRPTVWGKKRVPLVKSEVTEIVAYRRVQRTLVRDSWALNTCQEFLKINGYVDETMDNMT